MDGVDCTGPNPERNAFIFGHNDRTGAPYCLYKSFKCDMPSEHHSAKGDAIEFARWFECTRSPAPLAPAANQSIHTPAPAPVAPYVTPKPPTLAERLALQPAQRAEMEKATASIAELMRTGTKVEAGERTYLKNPDLNPAGLKQTADRKIIVPIYRPTADLKLKLKLTPFHGHLIVLAEGVRSGQTAYPQAALSGAIS